MDNWRMMRHLLTGGWRLKQALPAASLERIAAAIRASETRHDGQIRVAVEPALELFHLLRGVSARGRAIEMFSKLRVWDTEHNNGVLIYLLLAEHDVEIVADRGVHAHVGETVWTNICHKMEQAFREKRFEEGLLTSIHEVTRVLVQYYPKSPGFPNELPDEPVIL